jgi:hypothetical protein
MIINDYQSRLINSEVSEEEISKVIINANRRYEGIAEAEVR